MLARSWCLLREIMTEPQSAPDLAAWFGCSSKTIRREFIALTQIDLPIEKIVLPYVEQIGDGRVLFWLDTEAFVSWLLGGGQQWITLPSRGIAVAHKEKHVEQQTTSVAR
jgi:hypothetical protein